MISKSIIKYIRSLHQKKYRERYNVFLVEGEKNIDELLKSDLIIQKIFGIKQWFNESKCFLDKDKCFIISKRQLLQISNLKTPNRVLAIVKKPPQILDFSKLNKELFLVLDRITNPGNLGTIIRLADWFGITTIITSHDSVEYHNPKVLQASMGSFTRVKIYDVKLINFIKDCQTHAIPLCGTFLKGENIYKSTFPTKFGLVLGNESKGISKSLEKHISQKLTIPDFNNKQTNSLNIAMATAIILSEIRRR